MLTEKNLPAYPILLPEDLSKEAFIHWTDNSGKRHRLRGGINRFHTWEERKAAAFALPRRDLLGLGRKLGASVTKFTKPD